MEKDQKPQPNEDKPGEKKPVPQSGGNVVWYMLGVGVILLLVFSILNTGNGTPVTWSDRLAQVSPVILAVVFAAMGWTLAGFGNATIGRAFGWWALVFMATITLTRIFWLVVQIPMPRTPQWLMPALFVAVACLLAVHSIRSQHSTRPS